MDWLFFLPQYIFLLFGNFIPCTRIILASHSSLAHPCTFALSPHQKKERKETLSANCVAIYLLEHGHTPSDQQKGNFLNWWALYLLHIESVHHVNLLLSPVFTSWTYMEITTEYLNKWTENLVIEWHFQYSRKKWHFSLIIIRFHLKYYLR